MRGVDFGKFNSHLIKKTVKEEDNQKTNSCQKSSPSLHLFSATQFILSKR